MTFETFDQSDEETWPENKWNLTNDTLCTVPPEVNSGHPRSHCHCRCPHCTSQLSSRVPMIISDHHQSLAISAISSVNHVPMIISYHHQSLAISAISSVNHVISYQLSSPVFGHQCHLQCKPQYHISTVSIYLCNQWHIVISVIHHWQHCHCNPLSSM